jgi:hypothetical protein
MALRSLQSINKSPTSPVNVIEIMSTDTEKKEDSKSQNGFKLLLLLGMVAQNSMTVLVGRYTRSTGRKEDLYVVNHLLIVTELAKVGLSYVYFTHTV